MNVGLNEISKILQENNNFYILTHKSPDGDTLGSAFALCFALQKINKNAKVLCNDEIPNKYNFLCENIIQQNFEPEYVISIDISDTQLLGENLDRFVDKIDLCIDHHQSNSHFSKYWYIEKNSASTAEIIYKIIENLNVKIDRNIANCIYTGISTDTGCFRQSNTTARSYRIAAILIDSGADAFKINKIMFDTKTKAKFAIEKIVIENIEFFFNNICAIISINYEDIVKIGVCESDFDGISSIPKQIEGVLISAFIREQKPGIFKISMRTDESIDASEICAKLNGGGHRCAAGCTINGDFFAVKNKLLTTIGSYIDNNKKYERNNPYK